MQFYEKFQLEFVYFFVVNEIQDQFPVVGFKKSVKESLRRNLVCISLVCTMEPWRELNERIEAELRLPFTRMKGIDSLKSNIECTKLKG